MNRAEYIAALRGALRGRLAAQEVEDIVRDYMEFFEEGVALGKTEHQVAAELGDPVEVARQILSEEGGAPGAETARKVPGIDLGGIKEGFAKGAEKVADGAGRFASSANAFTREKMHRHAERPKKRPKPERQRSSAAGCLVALFKFMGLLVIAPALMGLLCLLVGGFVMGGAGLFAAICGFMAAAVAAPVVPVMLVVCAVVGLAFAACLSITVMLFMLWLGRAACLFVIDLYTGRRAHSADSYTGEWQVGEGSFNTTAAPADEAEAAGPACDEDEEEGGAHHA